MFDNTGANSSLKTIGVNSLAWVCNAWVEWLWNIATKNIGVYNTSILHL